MRSRLLLRGVVSLKVHVGVRVLAIVDDTEDIRRMLRVLLERAGAAVGGEAASVEDAISLMQPDSSGVVILDHHLAGQEFGLDGAAMIKRRAPAVKVVLLSAFDLEREAEASGSIDAFVRKDRLLELPRVVAMLDDDGAESCVANADLTVATAATPLLLGGRAPVSDEDRLLARWLSTPAVLFGTLPPPVEAANVVEQLLRPRASRSDVVLDFVAAAGEVDVAVGHLLALRHLIDASEEPGVRIDLGVLDLLIVEVTSSAISAARRAAMVDPLTGIGNRRAMEAELDSAIARCERSGQNLTLLFFDLVGLKAINDGQGHEAGDRALTLFARSLNLAKRAGDFIYRVGGDEFVAVLPDTDEAGADRFAGRLSQLGAPSFSFGSSNTADDGFDARRLVHLADVRMLQGRYARTARSESHVWLDLVDADADAEE